MQINNLSDENKAKIQNQFDAIKNQFDAIKI
jgi:hypothetical protein